MVAMLLGEGCYSMSRRVDRIMFLFFSGLKEEYPTASSNTLSLASFVITSKHSIVHRDG